MEAVSNERVPVLRFKDDGGEEYPKWDEETLGNIAGFSKGKGISKDDVIKDGNVRCIRYGELYTHYGTAVSRVLSRTDVPIDKLVLGRENDVLIPASGETAFDIASVVCLTTDNIALGGDINIIRSNQNGIFLAYYLISKKKAIARLAQGISVIHLYSKQLKTLALSIPSKPEQHKIANFLSSVDTRIGQLEKKRSLLEQYKKSLMQKLFSQEIRFKDERGEDYPEWEERRLGEVSRVKNGDSNRVDSGEYGEYAFFDRSQDIRRSDKHIFEGEAVIVAGEGKEFLPKYYVGKFDLHQRSYAIMNFSNISGKYVFYFLDQNRGYFSKMAVGSTMKSLRLPMFIHMPIKNPSIDEQQKIADLLSSIDRKIELINERVGKTIEFKKGLLQQMFV